jgi:hypothetical protein
VFLYDVTKVSHNEKFCPSLSQLSPNRGSSEPTLLPEGTTTRSLTRMADLVYGFRINGFDISCCITRGSDDCIIFCKG